LCGFLNSYDYYSKKERLTEDTTIKNYGLKDLHLMHRSSSTGVMDMTTMLMLTCQREIMGLEIVVDVTGGQLELGKRFFSESLIGGERNVYW